MPISNRTASDLQHLNPGVVVLSGYFPGNGASSPAAANVVFKGATVTHAGTTGRYNIVLPGKGSNDVLFAQASVLSTAGRTVTIRSYTPSTRTLVVDVYDLATPTAQNLTSSERMYVTVHVKNTSAR
jgi:hypothetical protein